jgi:hypothetical protein
MGESRWQRRERKLVAQRKAMKASGMSLKKVLLPLLEKRALEARKAAKENEKEVEETDRTSQTERAKLEKRRPLRRLSSLHLPACA